MNCLKIIDDYLEENNYDGLWNREGECACARLDNIAPCGELNIDDCNVGYFQAGIEKGFDFMIGAYHPKPCPKCKTERDIGPGGFRLSCPECGHEK